MESQCVVYDMHPCFKIYNVSYVLRTSPSVFCVLLYVCLGSVSVVTVCGNLLVIISIVYFKQLHTPTNSLILSLAVADLLVGVLVFPSSMAFPLSSCQFNETFSCRLRDSVDISLCTCSVLHLCCISVDRYYAVCRPLVYRSRITRHVAAVMILISWTFSVASGSSFTFAGSDGSRCDDVCLIHSVTAQTVEFTFAFYLPLTVMLGIYLKILLVARRQARRIHNTTGRSTKSGASFSRTERKATKTLATVMGAFLLCWFPFFFWLNFLSPFVSVPLPVVETLNWFVLCNSTINPFIYAFFYSWFRASFRMIVSGKIFQGDFTDSKL